MSKRKRTRKVSKTDTKRSRDPGWITFLDGKAMYNDGKPRPTPPRRRSVAPAPRCSGATASPGSRRRAARRCAVGRRWVRSDHRQPWSTPPLVPTRGVRHPMGWREGPGWTADPPLQDHRNSGCLPWARTRSARSWPPSQPGRAVSRLPLVGALPRHQTGTSMGRHPESEISEAEEFRSRSSC